MARIESDSLGKVEVPEDKFWGAQTQRSLQNFKIGNETFPPIFIKNYALMKKAAAAANADIGKLDKQISTLIQKACDEIIQGKLIDNFPLKVWQTGSGTQTNMNLNEVIANRATVLGGNALKDRLAHPNDHVNMGQSSNDSFPVAMALSCVEATKRFLDSGKKLKVSLEKKAREFKEEIKIGRTHLMDAVPMTVGQEFEAWASQIEQALNRAERTLEEVRRIPIGGTAIGTGLNTSEEFSAKAVEYINRFSGEKFEVCENKFSKIAGHDDLAALSGCLKNYALALHKVANDIRLLGSGPRCGLAELLLPANEPGSSIMPGKVNPTQCEAATMVCAQVIGNDTAVSFGASHGQLQLNAYKPLIVKNVLESCEVLSDVSASFRSNCVEGIKLNKEKLKHYLENSLMLVTALTPILGYEKCSEIAHKAYEKGTSIRQEVLEEGLMEETAFEEAVDLKRMV